MCENNIVYDAYYLISKFNDDKIKVTNIQIQKLMYFFEAYYMNIYNVDKLYDCHFNAWAFGPVAIPLYKFFRNFGNNNIIISEEETNIGNSISKDKKELLDKIYNVFKNVSPRDLVYITHLTASPWDKVWKKNGNKVGFGDNTYIDKIESRDWFKKTFEKK